MTTQENQDQVPQQRAPHVGLPRFQKPQSGPNPAALMEPTTEMRPVSDRPRPFLPQVQDESPKMSLFDRAKNAAGIPTGTFSADGPTAKPVAIDKELAVEAAAAVAGLLVLAGVVAVKFRYRGERKLRKPTERQESAVARPLANIAMRRAGLGKWGKDILEGAAALFAVGDYLNDGPLTYPITAETGEIPNPGDVL